MLTRPLIREGPWIAFPRVPLLSTCRGAAFKPQLHVLAGGVTCLERSACPQQSVGVGEAIPCFSGDCSTTLLIPSPAGRGVGVRDLSDGVSVKLPSSLPFSHGEKG